LTLTEADLDELRGINERVSLDEVADIYVPLARLLSLHITVSQDLFRVTDTFLGNPGQKVPFVIGIAGSVAVGKSTTARILQALLRHGGSHRHVDLIATDGFLYPNAVLTARGLMEQKGFPESYDRRRIVSFLASVKSGVSVVEAPVYSHHSYDIVPGASQVVERPDVLIVEGLNVLQASEGDRLFVSDLFDFSIYVDADERHVEEWYVERFLTLRNTAFRDSGSYFHRWSSLSDDEARETALRIWRDINGRNLVENIAPTKERARLILDKGADHSVAGVRLRRL
jgi:type I pantothenate kinase